MMQRIVKLGKRPSLGRSLELWSGDSIGYWDGDTLVVVTKNFNGLTHKFLKATAVLKIKWLTERFTRVGQQSLDYEFTVDDPCYFHRQVNRHRAYDPGVEAQLYEYACHEGNYGMANMLRAARRREAENVSDRVADIFRR